MTILRIMAFPHPTLPGRFRAFLNDDFLVTSRQPLADGARVLLERGHPPETPVTMRAEGKAYDSFNPLPLGEWAKYSYKESEGSSLRKVRWEARPSFPDGGSDQGNES